MTTSPTNPHSRPEETEHHEIDRLGQDLRRNAAVIPRRPQLDWIRQIRSQFECFRTRMKQHLAWEEERGYLQVVLDRRPTLSGRLENLRTEHLDLCLLLDELSRIAERMTPERLLLVRDFCNRAGDLIGYIEHHESEENDLLEFVFSHDIGTKD